MTTCACCVCVHMETGEKKNKVCEKKRMILNVRSVCREDILGVQT